MSRGFVSGVAAVLLLAASCRRIEPSRLDAVRKLRNLAPRFAPPAGGEITPAQIDLYLRVRRAGRHGSDIEAARNLGVDPVEFVWVRGRVLDALAYLDARRVQDGAAEAWTRSSAVLREARHESHDARTSARLDTEIAAVQKENAAARRADPGLAAGQRNAELVARRRREIDAVAP
ncbi:MAG TPA: hypothetical protein VH854_13425 [Thermoanaerobaculia bacterium]|nr:hypothetical protein [Thermoanaerobaculia bacterium]